MPLVIVLGIIGIAIFLLVEGGNMAIAPTTQVQKIAKAIAQAEGFYTQGSIPQRAHNPGDIEAGDLGYGTISGKTIYPADAQGWQALYNQVQAMLDNSSANYSPADSIQDVADEYVNGGANTQASIDWANNVADLLGVDVTTPIGQVS